MDGTARVQIREAVGIFHSTDSLNAAITDLASAGIDRADMSVLAPEAGSPGSARATADDPDAPRQAVYSDTDMRQGRTLATSMAGAMAALAAGGIVVMTGGAALGAIAAAVGAGGGIGVIGAMVGKLAGDDRTGYLAAQMARGGILLWVRIPEPGLEDRVCRILEAHAAADVHVHDIADDKSGRPVGDAS